MALSRVSGILKASINARLATAIKLLLLLLLLFQDTSALARYDSLLHSTCPEDLSLPEKCP